jgi:hypothetical protein
MEFRFQQGLKVSADNLLSNAISNRRNTKRSRTSICFWDVHPTHRRWKIASRRQPIPELVEVGRELGLEVLNRLLIYSGRSLVGTYMLPCLPDFPLRNVERLCFSHAARPVSGWPPLKRQHHGPFGPAPLQSLHPYYEPFCPCVL